MVGLLCAGGCAQQPPSKSGTLSGKRLRVTLTFQGAVNPFYHYYFLINLAGTQQVGEQNAPGPVPVLVPPYGNGFATASDGSANGFTDYVLFDNAQTPVTGYYGLYHVLGDPVNFSYGRTGGPVTFVTPDPNSTATYNRLQFEVDLAQLLLDSNGQPLSDAAAKAYAIGYLQVNVVATNIVPKSANQADKRTDALGNTSSLVTASAYLTLDLAHNQTLNLRNGDTSLPFVNEPKGDVFGGGDDSLDLTDWRIEVFQQ